MKDIVLITIDSWRRDTLSSMVNFRNVTDSFAVLDGIAQGGSTKTTLPPILSSNYWQNQKGSSSTEHTSLPSFLSDAGYTTAAFVGTNPFATRWMDDFDQFWNGGGRTDNRYVRNLSRGIDFALLRKETSARQVLKRAKRWYASTSSPQFMWVHLMDAHEPYYPGLREGIANGLFDTYRTLYEQKKRNRQEDFATDSLSKEKINTLERLYRRCVMNLDTEVARFLSEVDEDTTVMMTGDHGEAFNHGLRKHLQLYDELTRVPFLVRWTLDEEFGFSDEIFQIDIAPAIAAEIDQPIPDEWCGLSEPPAEERVSLMFNRDTRIDRLYIGCRTPRYKYIQNYSCSSEELVSEELYDLEANPKETDDIFDRSEDIVESFQKEIKAYFEETGLSPSSLAGSARASDSDDVSEEVKEKLSHLGYR